MVALVKAHAALVVDDLPAIEARLRTAGVEFIEAHDQPGVRQNPQNANAFDQPGEGGR